MGTRGINIVFEAYNKWRVRLGSKLPRTIHQAKESIGLKLTTITCLQKDKLNDDITHELLTHPKHGTNRLNIVCILSPLDLPMHLCIFVQPSAYK